MVSDGFPYPVNRPGNFSVEPQVTDAREPHDALKVAIWQALLPFQEELLSTGGVTFMGLRNAVAEAVRPFTVEAADHAD